MSLSKLGSLDKWLVPIKTTNSGSSSKNMAKKNDNGSTVDYNQSSRKRTSSENVQTEAKRKLLVLSDDDAYGEYMHSVDKNGNKVHYKQSGMTRAQFVNAQKLMQKLKSEKPLDECVTNGGNLFAKLKSKTKTVTNNENYIALPAIEAAKVNWLWKNGFEVLAMGHYIITVSFFSFFDKMM